MPLQATLPLSVVNVPNDYFSMAGFEVTLHGRFWVTPEAHTPKVSNTYSGDEINVRFNKEFVMIRYVSWRLG